MIAGYYRGWIDTVLSRLVDVLLASRSCCSGSGSRPPARSATVASAA